MSGKRYDVRIAVGAPNGPRSSVWHYWSRNDHVYVAHARMGGIEKFSFHPPNVCRRAFTKEHGTPAALTDRATHEWKRDPTPPSGLNKAVRVLRVSFPTDVLSTALVAEHKVPIWIEAAPARGSAIIDLMFTRDDEATLRAALQTEPSEMNHQLVAYRRLPGGEAFCVASWHSATPEKPLRVTASHEDLIISPLDLTGSGRPVRFTAFSNPKDGDFIQVWEFGAYAIVPPLTDQQWEALQNASEHV